jgi:hypothetical protein
MSKGISTEVGHWMLRKKLIGNFPLKIIKLILGGFDGNIKINNK